MARSFYKSAGGLRFTCTGCGACCRRPGPVYFTGGDLERAAAYLGMTPAAFRRRYRVRRRDGVPAVDPGPDSPCVFLGEDDRCTIYPARPTQCRTWPFWPEVVRRKRSWEKAARSCEGMNHGRRHSPAEIEAALEACRRAGLPEGDPW